MSTAYEPLAVVFARHAKPHVLGTAAIPDLEKRLEVLFATASEAMPGVALPIESFVAFVAARVPAAETPEGALDAVAPHAGDLYLAAALLAGDPRAIRRF